MKWSKLPLLGLLVLFAIGTPGIPAFAAPPGGTVVILPRIPTYTATPEEYAKRLNDPKVSIASKRVILDSIYAQEISDRISLGQSVSDRRMDYLALLFSNAVLIQPELLRHARQKLYLTTTNPRQMRSLTSEIRDYKNNNRTMPEPLAVIHSYLQFRDQLRKGTGLADLTEALCASTKNPKAVAIAIVLHQRSNNTATLLGDSIQNSTFDDLEPPILTLLRDQTFAAPVRPIPEAKEVAETAVNVAKQGTSELSHDLSDISGWLGLLAEIHSIEKRIHGRESNPTEEARATLLFNTAMTAGNDALSALEQQQIPSIELRNEARLRNVSTDEVLEKTRSAALAYLDGNDPHTLMNQKFSKMPYQKRFDTPRTAAIAATTLAIVVFRRRAPRSAPLFMRSLEEAHQAYANQNGKIPVGFRDIVLTRIERAINLYVASRTGGIGRAPSNGSVADFTPTPTHLARLTEVSMGETRALYTLRESRSLEVYYRLYELLKKLEKDGGRGEMIQAILAALRRMSEDRLAMTGERFHFSSAEAGRTKFRDALWSDLNETSVPSIAVQEAAILGLAATAHRWTARTMVHNIEKEIQRLEDYWTTLSGEDQTFLSQARDQFIENHHGTGIRDLPVGTYYPEIGGPSARPGSLGSRIEGRQRAGGGYQRFLPDFDWTGSNASWSHNLPQSSSVDLEYLSLTLPSYGNTLEDRIGIMTDLAGIEGGDVGMILLLIDVLKESRRGTLVDAADKSQLIPASDFELATLATLKAWLSSFQKLAATPDAEERTMPVADMLFPESKGSVSKNHAAARSCLSVAMASHDQVLIEAAMRAYLALPDDSDPEETRKSFIDTAPLLAAILTEYNNEEPSPFTREALEIAQALHERLTGNRIELRKIEPSVPSLPDAPSTPDPAPPIIIIQPETKAQVDDSTDPQKEAAKIHKALEFWLYSADELPEPVIEAAWKALLEESLGKGFANPDTFQLLLDSIGSEKLSSKQRLRGLQLFLHSIDHLATMPPALKVKALGTISNIANGDNSAEPKIGTSAIAIVNAIIEPSQHANAIAEVGRLMDCERAMDAATNSPRFNRKP